MESAARQRPPFLLREERVEHVVRDRARRSAVNAVLEEHHAGDLGLVARREEHEPAVVAQILVGLAGRALALVRDHLRRAGLARHVVRPSRACRRCRRRSPPSTAVADRLQLAGIDARPATAAAAAAPASSRSHRRPP
jgi:hypothetical protein